MTDIDARYMQLALDCARKSPPKPTNYCVGAVLVDAEKNHIISTGYTLELPGNTHAEQCCLQKVADAHGVKPDSVRDVLPPNAVIYTTMEPCIARLSGNLPCVDRVIQAGIDAVYCGVQEPDTFVKKNEGKAKLEAAGIKCLVVPGFDDEILAVATAGHDEQQDKS